MIKLLEFKSSSPTNRIAWIDVSRGIFMFFVLVVHTSHVPDNYDRVYSPFFLTGFFFLSGYLFHNPDKPFVLSFKLMRTIETVLVPYLVYWILSFSIEHLIKRDFNFIPLLVNDLLRGQKLWFISALVCTQIMFALFLSITKAPKYAIIFAVVSILVWYFTPLSAPHTHTPWCFHQSLVANFFLGMGYFIKTWQEKFVELIKNNTLGIVMVLTYIALVTYDILYLKRDISFPANEFGNISIYILYAFVGIYVVFFLSNKVTKYNWLLIFIGENSLLYYFYQNQVLKILKAIVKKMGITQPDYVTPTIMAIAVAILLIIPILLTKKYFPLIAGKSMFISKNLKK